MGYADKTDVPVEKTKHEIEQTLRRYKADQFVSGWSTTHGHVMFKARGRLIKFTVSLPSRDERRFTHDARRNLWAAHVAEREYEQAIRTVWRRLLLCIKAKLESVDSGIESFESAFLAHIVLPGNVTVGDWAAEKLDEVYRSGQLPSGFLALPPGPSVSA